MKKFTLGMIAGASSLAIAVPLIAQFASAASSTGSSSNARTLPIPTQACVQALAGLDDARLSSMDAMMAAEKQALKAQRDALAAAASIADDTKRQAAVQQANQDFRTAMQAMEQSDAMKSAMDTVKSACGNAGFGMGGMGMGMFGGMMGHGPREGAPENLAQKLGMTTDELKAELQSGKTPEQIAQEHGITLPAKGGMMRGGHRGWMNGNARSNSSTSTSNS